MSLPKAIEYQDFSSQINTTMFTLEEYNDLLDYWKSQEEMYAKAGINLHELLMNYRPMEKKIDLGYYYARYAHLKAEAIVRIEKETRLENLSTSLSSGLLVGFIFYSGCTMMLDILKGKRKIFRRQNI